jgi:hypothetical protein
VDSGKSPLNSGKTISKRASLNSGGALSEIAIEPELR